MGRAQNKHQHPSQAASRRVLSVMRRSLSTPPQLDDSSQRHAAYYPGIPEGIYAAPSHLDPKDESDPMVGWLFRDEIEVCFPSAPAPIVGVRPAPGHDVFDEFGEWVGADSEHPHLRFTTAAVRSLSAEEAQSITARYQTGDYGDGEAGFATYSLADGRRIWMIDDAVRSPEGAPPRRDPSRSPGPLTVLLPSDY